MAKINSNWWEKAKKIPKKQVIEPEQGVEPIQSSQHDMSILKRLEQLEARNRELEKKVNEEEKTTFQKAKEINKDPRKFSYSMWWWVPVLSYKSKKIDNTRDWHFKNKFGEYESNHLLELKLADGSTTDVEVVEFNRSATKSEKMIAYDENGEYILLGSNPKSFTFKTEEHWEFTVLPCIIN